MTAWTRLDMEAMGNLEKAIFFRQGINGHYKSEQYKCSLCRSK